MELLYPLGARLVVSSLRLWYRWEVAGAEHVPGRGAAIVAANHVSALDPLMVGSVIWRRGRYPRFLAKAELFRRPLLGPLLRGIGQIPVDRGRGEREPLDRAEEALRRGEIVVVFPEGGVRRPITEIRPLQSGAARLALATGAPLVPAVVRGGEAVLDATGWRRLRPGRRLVVRVGAPIHLAGPTGPRAMREGTSQLRERLEELWEQLPPLAGCGAAAAEPPQ